MDRTFKQRCIDLRAQDLSLTEIVRITERPKASVYEHIRHIPLTSGRIAAARAAAAERARQLSASRKGKSRRPFWHFGKWSRRTVLLTAHLLFDGELGYARCAYNNRNGVLIRRVASLMGDIYDFEPTRYQNACTGVSRISYHNVALAAYMRSKAEELQETILQLPRGYKREFLRAFFDDEGCADFRPETRRRSIRGYQKDKRILHIIQDLLRGFDIASRIIAPNEVVIVGRTQLMRFENEIGFSAGVRVNGSRSNSRWKQNLEKRVILRRAIESFHA